MTASSIKYTSEDMALVTFGDGSQVFTAIPSGDGPTQRAIDEALANGLVIAPYEQPPALEPVVHVAWLRAALAESGELAAVDRAAGAADPVTKQLWDYATTVRRQHLAVIAIGSALRLDLDQLFARAEALRAAHS